MLAGASAANEASSCLSQATVASEEAGQSLLQTKRQNGISSAEDIAPAIRNNHAIFNNHSKGRKVRVEGRPVFLGNMESLDDKGFQVVANTCCQLEMELYIRRAISSLGLELCDESSILAMLPMYNTCGTDAHDYATLVQHIRSGVPPNPCAFVAPAGTCPAGRRGAECQDVDPEPASHRRRQCSPKIEKGPAGDCQLPPGAVWCQVRLKNLSPYWMAVYDWDVNEDWVSYNICQAGFWEESNIEEFGPPGHMLDIGGNIGYHTFAFAQAGWTTTTFEPMAPNLALQRATMCRNPVLASRVSLQPHGLGTLAQQCTMTSPIGNVGDGFTACGAAAAEPIKAGFKEIGKFNVRRLDEVLSETKLPKVDLVKIDVEGFESEVFAGAPDFLAQYHPRVVISEVWSNMVGADGPGSASGIDYLDRFEKEGYHFFEDSRCKTQIDAKKKLSNEGGMDVFMCLP